MRHDATMLIDTRQQQTETSAGFVQKGCSDRSDPNLSLLGSSHAIRTLRSQLAKIALTDANLLLRGEAASGKRAAALSVHNQGARRAANFVTISCGASEAVELSKALSCDNWADQSNLGRAHHLARAHGGTLFLQDVTELPLQAQNRLHKLLQSNAMAVPGTQHPLDIRIIASSTCNPLHAIETGALSADFYYLLSEFQLQTPSLRHRKDDVPELAQRLLNAHAGPQRRFDETALELLAQYHYPGNLQELKNVVAHAAVFGGRLITTEALPDFVTAKAPETFSDMVVGESIAQIERRLIMATLKHYEGDKQRSAKTLGISVKTLYNRLRSYDRPGIR